ncbi:MAG: hypothetical protein RL264_1481 [Bacteroidota bacterium]
MNFQEINLSNFSLLLPQNQLMKKLLTLLFIIGLSPLFAQTINLKKQQELLQGQWQFKKVTLAGEVINTYGEKDFFLIKPDLSFFISESFGETQYSGKITILTETQLRTNLDSGDDTQLVTIKKLEPSHIIMVFEKEGGNMEIELEKIE